MFRDKYKYEKINNIIYEQPKAEGFLHAMTMMNFFYEIKSQVKMKGSSWNVTVGNYPLKLSAEEYVVPDIMVFFDKKHITNKGYQGIPAFIAEIETPLTRFKDRDIKKNAYAQLGVEEYWIIDPIERSVEIYYLEAGHYILQKSYTINNNELSPDCVNRISISLKNISVISIQVRNIFLGITTEDNYEA